MYGGGAYQAWACFDHVIASHATCITSMSTCTQMRSTPLSWMWAAIHAKLGMEEKTPPKQCFHRYVCRVIGFMIGCGAGAWLAYTTATIVHDDDDDDSSTYTQPFAQSHRLLGMCQGIHHLMWTWLMRMGPMVQHPSDASGMPMSALLQPTIVGTTWRCVLVFACLVVYLYVYCFGTST